MFTVRVLTLRSCHLRLTLGRAPLYSLILVCVSQHRWMNAIGQKINLPRIRWLSLDIHIMGTERRAQVRPICSIFERLEPVFGNLKHELANRGPEFWPCSDKSNQKRIALQPLWRYSQCRHRNWNAGGVSLWPYIYHKGIRDKKEYFYKLVVILHLSLQVVAVGVPSHVTRRFWVFGGRTSNQKRLYLFRP